MKTPEQIAETIPLPRVILPGKLQELMVTAINADRAQRDLVALIAETLDDRGATDAADLVRDTDPDDDLWNNYIGPMLDSIEDDYTRMAKEINA